MQEKIHFSYKFLIVMVFCMIAKQKEVIRRGRFLLG